MKVPRLSRSDPTVQMGRSSRLPSARLARTLMVLLVAALPALVLAQSQMDEVHDLIVVAGGGHVLQLVDAAVTFSDSRPLPAQPGAEFSLFHALQAGEILSIWLQKNSDGGPTWLVTLTDGSIEWVEGGEVSFSGTVVGSSWPGVTGYLSLHLGPDPTELGAYRAVYFPVLGQ